MSDTKYFARIDETVAQIHVHDWHGAGMKFKAYPSTAPWEGWQEVPPEKVAILRKAVLNPSVPAQSQKIFKVVTEDEYKNIVRESRAAANKSLDAVAQAQLKDLQSADVENKKTIAALAAENNSTKQEMAGLKEMLAQLLAASGVKMPVHAPSDSAQASPSAQPAEASPVAPSAPANEPIKITGTPRPGKKNAPTKVDVIVPETDPATALLNEPVQQPS